MDLTKAEQLIGEAVENSQAKVPTDELALACATVLLHRGLMGLTTLELPQNASLVVRQD